MEIIDKYPGIYEIRGEIYPVQIIVERTFLYV